ncbi:anthranilate synthase component II [Negadavirga shengliensis]|uniref:Anthranilate synthase component II n=1 Tax=Negadavirga shengliensis TaxID=1389218 RepID=A0ABV9SV71_9BACT
MILLVDNFDSFSHILADYFLRTGVELEIVRNDVSLEALKRRPYEALVISPGPETPEKAGNLMEILGYYHDKIPVLGICLGHQAIGTFFGGRLAVNERPMHGKVSTVRQVCPHVILDGLPDTFEVTRYHSLELKELPPTLNVLLETRQKEVMAIAHTYFPVVGLQFHPEAHLTQFGFELIHSWVKYIAVTDFLARVNF